MTLPAGWVWRSSNDELVAASSDGSATLRVQRMSSSGLDLAALEASLDGVEVSVRGEPANVVVDGHEGASIELEETRSTGVFVVRLVIVPVGNEAFRFEAAGPIAMWDSGQTDINAMVVGTRFAP